MTSVISVLVSEKILDNKILCPNMSSATISGKQQQDSNSNIRNADPQILLEPTLFFAETF